MECIIIDYIMFADYLERLYNELEQHICSKTKPVLVDPKPRSLASTGPATVEPQEPYQGRDLGKKKLFYQFCI